MENIKLTTTVTHEVTVALGVSAIANQFRYNYEEGRLIRRIRNRDDKTLFKYHTIDIDRNEFIYQEFPFADLGTEVKAMTTFEGEFDNPNDLKALLQLIMK